MQYTLSKCFVKFMVFLAVGSKNCPKTVPRQIANPKNGFRPMFSRAKRTLGLGTVWGLPWEYRGGNEGKREERQKARPQPLKTRKPPFYRGFVVVVGSGFEPLKALASRFTE